MPEPHDWEADPRYLEQCLVAWRDAHGWSNAEAARRLRVPYRTLWDWLPGGRRVCRLEGLVRRTMTLIDLLDIEGDA